MITDKAERRIIYLILLELFNIPSTVKNAKIIKEILPIIDNLERAIAADGSLEDLKKGVEMTMKGCQDAFTKLGVEEIDATGEFDPNFHNAVMHVEDENLEKNVVAEVFQKGYKKDNKIIRHTMVKVAN